MADIGSIFNFTPEAPAAPAGTQVAAPTTTIPQTGNEQTLATPGTDVNGVVPAGPNQASAPNSPLDSFKSLWDTPKTDGTVTTPAAQELTAENVAAAVGKQDFKSFITPEALAAIAEGGEGAQAAFASSMDIMAKQILTQSTLVSQKLAANAIEKALQAQSAALPTMLRDQSVVSHMRDSNPMLSDPAIKPVVTAVSSQLQRQFPDSTPVQIMEMTVNYLSSIKEAVNPAAVVKEPGVQDWDKYLTE